MISVSGKMRDRFIYTGKSGDKIPNSKGGHRPPLLFLLQKCASLDQGSSGGASILMLTVLPGFLLLLCKFREEIRSATSNLTKIKRGQAT